MNVKEILTEIYGIEIARATYNSLVERIAKTKSKRLKTRRKSWDESNVVLITYADQFREVNKSNLTCFEIMYKKYYSDLFDTVHLLPFYPYSSDDGFSVIDYKSVKDENGTWENIDELSKSTRLMFDFVCNHVSAESLWFKEYLDGNPDYQDFFISVDPSTDLQAVTRPRATPLLTKFQLHNGREEYLWTTFSDDQVDLNYKNPKVLLKMIDVLLFYLEHGAEYIRLDAIGFTWKELGTPCIHNREAHLLVKLFRYIVDQVAYGTLIITETNVPEKENISYFGNGYDEAHMVYQFPLPPLVLYSIINENGSAITNWAKHLRNSGDKTTFFNFLASHDGIGLNPIRGIIPEEEIVKMVKSLEDNGALVSYKKNSDGSKSPYEVNVTFFDALSKQNENADIKQQKFIVAHAILLSIPGVPAIYVQSILGSKNDYKGVSVTGRKRTINREKYDLKKIISELENVHSIRSNIYHSLAHLIRIRKSERLFHPKNKMIVLDLDDRLFACKRVNAAGDSLILIHNLSDNEVTFPIKGRYKNLLTNELISINEYYLTSYQFVWLKKIQ